MKKIRKSILNKDGSALLTVLLVVLISTIMAASFFTMGTQHSFMANKLANRTRAISIAEAGINSAYSILTTNFEASANDNAFPLTAYGGGQFDVTVIPLSNDILVIKSSGIYNGISEEVILDVKKKGGATGSSGGGSNTPPVGSAWECSIFAAKQLKINGNGDISGNAHSNQKFGINGNMDWGTTSHPVKLTTGYKFVGNGNIDIHGSAKASVRITLSGIGSIDLISCSWRSISGIWDFGEITNDGPEYPIRPFPAIDLTPYYQIAAENGQIHNGNLTYNGNHSLGEIPGGVKVVNGILKINGNFSMHGMLIASNKIILNGNCDILMSNNGFSGVFSRDSYVYVNGNHTIYGAVYANGNIKLNGNGTIYGQIISNGHVRLNGNYGTIHYVYSDPDNIGGGGGGGSTPPSPNQRLIVTAWQK